MSFAPIQRFQIVDVRLWRGARPDTAGAAWLRARGLATDIDLEWEQGDDSLFVPSDGVTLIRLPDFEPLPAFVPGIADSHVKRFLETVARVAPPTFVHCVSGQNRTGVAIAAYRMLVKGEPTLSVIADFESFGGIWAGLDRAYLEALPTRFRWDTNALLLAP
jgi:protein tyrosine/serine phosphatase